MALTGAVDKLAPTPQGRHLYRGPEHHQGQWLSTLSYSPQLFTKTELQPAQEIIGARARFPKPTDRYAVLRVFGTNITSTEGDEWKHQRKMVASAFSEVRPIVFLAAAALV